jgi:hypothetical protein
MSSSINSVLYRPLKSGKEYIGLIPAYQKVDQSFDKKSDNSDTYDTLNYMSQWAYKYVSQMAKIAPLLKGNTLQETVNKIYGFLYSHFQYKLDGETQNLYSPSAAWHFREKGFDCKTYSILASTILQNLKIPHSFRMVKQAGVNPGEWSHVYVIVPNGSSYYVIDGTTHNNREVNYTNKYDYDMIHKGLASPYISTLGCACTGKKITKYGLGAPSTLSKTIANFHVFLNEIEKKGVSQEVTTKMLALVKYNVENGIDPNMGEILEKALAQTNGLGATFGLNPIGGNFSQMTVGNLPSGNYYPPSSAGSTFGNAASSIASGPFSNLSVGGITAGSIMGAATGNPIAIAGLVINVLKKIIPIEKTFGAVFANGFDLSCWGSSYSEQKAKEDILIWIPFLRDWSGIYTSPTTANLDRFQFATQSMINDAINGQQSKYAKCSRKGWALVQKAVEELKKNTYEEFRTQGFQLTSLGSRTGANWTFKLPNRSDNYYWANSKVLFESLQVTNPVAQTQQQPNSQTTIDANGNPVTAVKSGSSITPIAIGGALLLAAKLLL